jgi:hypothetical protein
MRAKKLSDSAEIEPPKWLSKAQKTLFLDVISARKAAGKPVLPGEIATLTDFVLLRGRIQDLSARLKRLGKLVLKDDRLCVIFAKQLDASAGLSLRLSQELQLASPEWQI